MKKHWSMIATVGAVAVVAIGFVLAQDKPPAKETPRPDDEKAIRDTSDAIAKAFEKGDAAAFAAFFTEEGEYQDEDKDIIRGRDALTQAYAKFFAKRPELKVETKIDKIRFLGKDTAVEEGTFTVKAKDTPPNASKYSTLYTRQDGKWMIALLKEWGDDKENEANIEDLAWLIGSWESDGDGSKAKTKYEWSENKKFIKSQYTVQIKLKDRTVDSTGTQVIGVDPAVGLIRAWTFDSDGGVGESTWVWQDDKWVIESSASLADGTDLTATNFLTRAGDDAFTWRSVRKVADGVPQPDSGIVKVKRVKQ
jgi:uncharacterized protein (TIGR02246 family)